MKKYFFFSLILIISFTLQVNAQVDNIYKVGRALDNIERGKKTLDQLKALIPPKKNKADSLKSKAASAVKSPGAEPPGTLITNVSIAGIDFAKLRLLTENIKACSGVQSAEMKYSSASSAIIVTHSGSTTALLKLMEETSGDIFTAKNIENFEEGKISIKLK